MQYSKKKRGRGISTMLKAGGQSEKAGSADERKGKGSLREERKLA